MPTLTLLSLYNARQSLYAEQLARARAELERFEADIVARLGQETADAVRQWRSWTEDMIFGRTEVLPLSDEGEVALKTLRELTGNVKKVLKDIRTPDCRFKESVEPISVLETVGLSWEEVEEKYVGDGRLSFSGVLELLRALNTTPQTLPTDEQAYEWAGEGLSPVHLPHEWRRALRGRKRRLALLLRTAAELEEEVKYER
jgi:hypothetical protein